MNLTIEHKTATINDSQMIPLINVVFLMLAFILITGNIEKSNERSPVAQELNVPSSSSNLEQEVHDVIVTLANTGALFVNETPTTTEELATVFPLKGTELATSKVLIRADAVASAHSLRGVIKILRDLGLRRISLATIRAYSSSQN